MIKADSENIATVKTIVDERTLELYNLSVEINTNKVIREFLYKKAPLNNNERYHIKDILDLVQSYKAGNNFVSLIAVYLTQSSSIVTSEGVYDADYFFQNVLRYENRNPEEIKQIMNEVHYNTYLPRKKINGSGILSGEYITYIQTIPIGEKQPLASVIMLIDQRNISSAIGDAKSNTNHEVIILTKDGDIVFSNPRDEGLVQSIISKVDYENNSFIINTGKTDMLFSYSTSQVNDWIYVTFSTMDNVIARLNKVRNWVIVIAIISLGIGIVLSLIMTNLNYRPWALLINQIKRFYYNKTSPAEGIESENEYIFAINAVNNMIKERDELQRDISKNQTYIKKYILQDLCSGKAVAMDNGKKRLIFPYKSYCVIIVEIDDKVQLNSKLEKILIKLIGLYFDNCIIYTFRDKKDRLCIVLNTAFYGAALVLEHIKHLKDMISAHLDVLLYVGIGDIYEDIEHIRESYEEAGKALEYSFLTGWNSMVFYPDIKRYIISSLNLPIYSDNPLLNSVKTGDIKSCTKLLDEYFNNVVNGGSASTQYMYCLFYNFVSIIIKVCNEIRADFEEIFAQTPEQILDIDRYRNPKHIISSVYDIYTRMCDYIQENKKSQDSNLKNYIDDYIQNNYTNQAISLVGMADDLGYSASYLSRFIKEEYGIGFGSLLSKKRLDYAKELLISGSKSIGEISETVGYTSINSFTRAFKREEGINPSQYRDILLLQEKKTV